MNTAKFLLYLFRKSFLNGDRDRNRCTDHRVVAHTDKTHHFDVSGNGGRTCELRIGMHTAHSVGHTVRSSDTASL